MLTIRNSYIYIVAVIITLRYGLVSYLFYPTILFFQKNYRFNKIVLLYLLVIMLFFSIKAFFETDILVPIENLKYYFGFILFLLIFQSSSNKINNSLNLLFVLLFISIIAEYFIINYELLPIEYWFNVTHSDGTMLHPQTMGDMRPYGIGKNATITATLLTVLYVHIMTEVNHKYLNSFKKRVLFTVFYIATIVLLRSGLGFFISMIAIYFVVANTSKKRFFYTVIFAILFVITFYIVESNLSGFSRFSISYLDYLIGFKKEQIFVSLLPENYGYIEFLFGALNQRGFTNDIGWIPFFYSVGFVGLLLYLFILLVNVNRYNKKSLFILLLGAFHYAAIFSIPGQILFAYLLSRRSHNI